ncbi:hypothetical protein [Salana multivorans]
MTETYSVRPVSSTRASRDRVKPSALSQIAAMTTPEVQTNGVMSSRSGE